MLRAAIAPAKANTTADTAITVRRALRSQLDDAKEDRDRWRAQAERLAFPAPSNVSHENLLPKQGSVG